MKIIKTLKVLLASICMQIGKKNQEQKHNKIEEEEVEESVTINKEVIKSETKAKHLTDGKSKETKQSSG